MEEAEPLQYWCHMCSQTVNPIMGIDTINCPICQSGFVEEMASAAAPGNETPLDFELGGSDHDRSLSLWAPILLGMMDHPHRRRRIRRTTELDDDENGDENENNRRQSDEESELDRELESIMRRRRRSSATILQLLQGIRAGILSDSANPEANQRTRDRINNPERVILINPVNQTIIVQGSFDPNNSSQNREPLGSLGDYFIGPGLELLLQHLSENDPNRYGSPPAQKEAVEALPTVKLAETQQCSVCLDECEIGDEVKEMPCKHKFHSNCILPWLELHSSCPVCRYQLPGDESKLDSNNVSNQEESNNFNGDNNGVGGNSSGDERNESGRQFSVLPWPFSSLFSSSSSRSSNRSSSSTSANATPSTSREDDEN